MSHLPDLPNFTFSSSFRSARSLFSRVVAGAIGYGWSSLATCRAVAPRLQHQLSERLHRGASVAAGVAPFCVLLQTSVSVACHCLVTDSRQGPCSRTAAADVASSCLPDGAASPKQTEVEKLSWLPPKPRRPGEKEGLSGTAALGNSPATEGGAASRGPAQRLPKTCDIGNRHDEATRQRQGILQTKRTN